MTVELLNKKFEGLTFDSKGQYVFSRDESTNYE